MAFLAIFLRWRGVITWVETAYCFPTGIAFGSSLAGAFIGLTAGLDSSQVAVATSGYYLSLNLGSMIGISGSSAIVNSFVRWALVKHLKRYSNAHQIIRDVTSNFDSIGKLPREIAGIVLQTYTRSLQHVWCKCSNLAPSSGLFRNMRTLLTPRSLMPVFCLVLGCMAFLASFLMREGQMNQPVRPVLRESRPSSSPGRIQGYNTLSRPGDGSP